MTPGTIPAGLPVIPPEPRGRRERRKAVTRSELLLAGRKLFSEKGLHECRVEEITERADLGKGTLYQYFDSKEELVLAVVGAGLEELGRFVEERVRNAESIDDAADAIVRSHLEFFCRNPELLRIFHQVRGTLIFKRPEWRPLRRILEVYLGRMARRLARAAPPGKISRARARELASLLFGGVSGWFSVRVAVLGSAAELSAPRGLAEALVAMAVRFASAGRETQTLPRGRRSAGPATQAAARAKT